MKNYSDFVQRITENFKLASRLPLNTEESIYNSISPKDNTALKDKNILIFAPHPDDECITGLLPLRFMIESGAKIIDVAVTLGSKLDRRAERLQELTDACEYLDWGLRVCGKDGFENMRTTTKENDPTYWNKCVDEIASIIEEYKPIAIFAPHLDDWNATHIGTSLLISDAVEKIKYDGIVINSEYWGGIRKANLMVEASNEYVAAQMQALARHTKEVERNDYHLRLPAWMSDNVRRGAELVGGQGMSAPKFFFATLYNVQKFKDGKWQPLFERKFLTKEENASDILK